MTTTAAGAWTAALAAWAIPEPILAAAPANPWAFPASAISVPSVDPLITATGRRVSDHLSPGEPLLDVGCGAGRIAGAFTSTHEVVGVEPRDDLADVAASVGVDVRRGRWPDLAEEVGRFPVVLCTHVLYDVADPVPFLRALDAAATRQVVLEVTDAHPWAGIGRFYERFHGIGRPDGPTADMLAAVVDEVVGVVPTIERWPRPSPTYDSLADLVGHYRRMVCLPESADPQLAEMLAAEVLPTSDGGEAVRLPDRLVATLTWSPTVGSDA